MYIFYLRYKCICGKLKVFFNVNTVKFGRSWNKFTYSEYIIIYSYKQKDYSIINKWRMTYNKGRHC